VAFAGEPADGARDPGRLAGGGEIPAVDPAAVPVTPTELIARAGGEPAGDPVTAAPVRPEIARALDEALTAIPGPDVGPAPGGSEQTEGSPIHSDMPRGTQALAQLHNGNFFIGSVKRIDSPWVTLNLPQGEVTFSHAELRRLMPLASADFRTLSQGITLGSVRLKNNNRLVGQILRDQEGSVIVDLETAKITIPKENIEEVSTRPLSEFGFGNDDEEALFKDDLDAGTPASRRADLPLREARGLPSLRVIVDQPAPAGDKTKQP
jgi:hypothetical protein